MDRIWSNKLIKTALITVAVFLVLKYLLPLFVPFVIAYIIAAMLHPVVLFMTKRLHFPAAFSAIFMVAIFMALLGVGIFFLGKIGINQLSSLAADIPDYKIEMMTRIDKICTRLDMMLGEKQGSVKLMLLGNGFELGNTGRELLVSATKVTFGICTHVVLFLGFLLVIFVSAVLMLIQLIKDEPIFNHELLDGIKNDFAQAGAAYLKTQLILIAIISVICVAGLFAAGSRYALVIGVVTGILDALPVLGSGFVLVPYAVISFFKGSIKRGVVVIITYIISQVVREFLEPKLLGHGMGIKPLYMVMSMYVGLKLFGVAGFILGPLGLILIISLTKAADNCDIKKAEGIIGNGK
ncbi:MAG: AI-2E family transporter [Clostridiales bacterium]|nr:AI-2E family transporter [Clostridiales bacterium]